MPGALLFWLDSLIVIAVVLTLSAASGPISWNPWLVLPVRAGWMAAIAAMLVATRLWMFRWSGGIAAAGPRLLGFARDRTLRHAIAIAVVTRLVIFGAGLAGVLLVGHAEAPTAEAGTEVELLPGRWDAGWYVGVAAGGYRWSPGVEHNSRLAFFPGFPIALRTVARLLHFPQSEVPWLWTGVVLSTLFFAGALYQLHRLVRRWFDDATANRTVLLTAAYPFALFFGQVYSESLFLLAAIGATRYFVERRPRGAIAFGLIAGLTRPTGATVACLLAGVWWRDRPQRGTDRALTAAAIVAPIAGMLLYSLYVFWVSGHAFAWITDQAGWGRVTVNPAAFAMQLVADVRQAGLVGFIRSRPYDSMNIAALMLALAPLVWIARHVGVGAALFVLLGVIGPLRIGGVVSMGRFTIVLFPLFMAYARWTQHRTPVLAACWFAAQVALAILFFTDRPVF